MRERFAQASGSSPLLALAPGATGRFTLTGEHWSISFKIEDGRLSQESETTPEPSDFTLVASDEVWSELLADQPLAGAHSLVTLVRSGVVMLRGDALAYDRCVQIVRALVDSARVHPAVAEMGRPLSAVGSYHRVTTSLGTSDLYVERMGSGTPLLAFATAGSDTSQWHGVMTHSDLTDQHELITVDLPWHGKSAPTWGDSVGSYRLDPETYTEIIVAVSDALALEKPVLIGVSMGGAAVVHAIATHPERFGGAVSCQAGPSVQARAHEHLRGTRVNPALFIPEWTYGLMNPASPEAFKQRVWWGYSSGGFGLYAADIDSYLAWNLTAVEHLLRADSPHIAVLSGAFDTSVPSARSEELAARIPNASYAQMPELGHFPHAENPAAFVRHLVPALDRVLRRAA